MATRRWLGAAAAVKDVYTLALSGTWTAADVITLTINNVDFVLTIGTDVTNATVATSLKQAFNGETLTDTTYTFSPNLTNGAQGIGMFAELVATVSSTTVTFTARTAGIPITISAARTTASSGAISFTHATTATGPNYWDNTDNWSGNTVPVDNDTVVFDSGAVDCLYGLSTGIQPAATTVTLGYAGKIGLPEINTSGGTALTYSEYRTKFLTFDDNSVTNTVTIGGGSGDGSSRLKFDFGAGQTALTVLNTGSTGGKGDPAVICKGTHASNAFNVQNGSAGFGYIAGDSTTIATLRVGTDANSSASVTSGADCTLTTIVLSGGSLAVNSNTTTTTQYAGTLTQYAGAPATLRVYGGKYVDRSTSTIGTELTVGSVGVYDRSGDNRSKTVTPVIQLFSGSQFLDPNASITYTAGFKTNGCRLADCKVDVGSGRTFTVA